MTARFPDSPDYARLHTLIDHLNGLSYRERRLFLWHQLDPRLPRFLYKFRALDPSSARSIDHIRDLVVRSRLWLSSPKDFNDPFDMSAHVVVEGTIDEKRQRIDAILKRRGLAWNERRKQLSQMMSKTNAEFARIAQQQQRDYAERCGVVSFGGDPRSILMWSHYAANHEGVCFQFETARDPTCFTAVIRVNYSEDYPVVNWISENEFLEGLGATLERKHEDWRYEAETRIIIPDSAHDYLPFRPESLRAVIIGCRAAPTTVQQLQNIIEERTSRGLPPVILYRASKHPRKYELVVFREPVKSV